MKMYIVLYNIVMLTCLWFLLSRIFRQLDYEKFISVSPYFLGGYLAITIFPSATTLQLIFPTGPNSSPIFFSLIIVAVYCSIPAMIVKGFYHLVEKIGIVKWA